MTKSITDFDEFRLALIEALGAVRAEDDAPFDLSAEEIIERVRDLRDEKAVFEQSWKLMSNKMKEVSDLVNQEYAVYAIWRKANV